MRTVTFYLNCCAILGIINATALSLQASSLGYNASYKSVLTPTGASHGHKFSSISSKMSLNAPDAYNSTLKNDTVVSNASSSSACCFVVQNTIDVRYWADYFTEYTSVSTYVTTFITFATQYIDTTVTTNVSTVVKTFIHNTTLVSALGTPGIPNTYNDASGPFVAQIGLNGSLATTFGATITSPTQVYVFPSVNVIKVPAVTDKDGRPACATKSMYQATCPAQIYGRWNFTAAKMDRYTESAKAQSVLYITGINSNAERYFSSSPKQESAMIPVNLDAVQVLFSKPFVYAPSSDQFPSKIANENLGYVPQTLIEWMARDSDYVSKVPGIASCLPGGPSVDFFSYFCPPLTPGGGNNFLQLQFGGSDLTVSSTVTVAGEGCFHPGACPTPAAPGATAVVTAQAHETSSLPGPKNLPRPQAPSQPLSAQAENQANAPVSSAEGHAVNPAPNPLPDLPRPLPAETANQSPSAPTAASGNPLVNSPENFHGANPPLKNPAKPPSRLQSLGAIIASAIGIAPTSPPDSQDIKPSPGPTPTQSYSISIAPTASAIVINGVTSILPAYGAEGGVVAGILPIAVGSQQISRNAASQYLVAGQTITPGAPPINVQGTEVSLAPSASAIVIAGSTIAISSTSVPGFTVGAETVTANSASQYIAGGHTLVPGGLALTVSGTRISLAPSGTQVVVGSSTIGLAPTFSPLILPPPLTLGSQTYTASSDSEYTIGSQILTPGGPAITVSGTRLSLAPSATQVVVGSSTIGLGPVFTPPPITFGSQTFTANSASDYIIDRQTLIPGAPAITVSGTPISLAPDATQEVIGSSTIELAPATMPPLLTFGSQTFTANTASDYIIDGQTLVPGAPPITISNTPISLAPGASEVVIGGSTEILRSGLTLPPIIIGSHTFTANNAGAYVIGSQTLTPGASGIVVPESVLSPGASLSVFTVAGQVFTANPTAFSIDGTTISAGGPGVTIFGTPVSLQASGVLDIGNSTITLSSAKSTNGFGLAAFTGEGDRTALQLLYSVSALVLILSVAAML